MIGEPGVWDTINYILSSAGKADLIMLAIIAVVAVVLGWIRGGRDGD